MKKNVLIYGLISGVIVASLMLFNMNNLSHCEGNMDYNKSMVIGYAAMLIAFSLVFVGIKNYRDKYNSGLISFGKAFKIGTLIVLIASTIYVGAWLVDYYCFKPDFMEKYAAHMIDELKKSGASAAKIEEKTKESAKMVQMMKNPVIHGLVTYTEILPVGLIVTLISSLILKRKNQQ